MQKRCIGLTLTAAIVLVFHVSQGNGGNALPVAVTPPHYIDTPRQFSIKVVTKLTSKELVPGSGIFMTESVFDWNKRCEELLVERLGVPPGGSVKYDPTWDRLSVVADKQWRARLLALLNQLFPDDFRPLPVEH
ncbi:MAG: hypothetical protein V4710_24685 [Verrucomicrobiota bacterium]